MANEPCPEPADYLAQRAEEESEAKPYIDHFDELDFIEEQFDLCDPDIQQTNLQHT